MKQIGSLFEKYRKTLRPPQATVELKALEVIRTVANINLEEGQLSYNVTTRVLRVNAPSVIKTELCCRKKALLEVMKRALGDSNAPVEIL